MIFRFELHEWSVEGRMVLLLEATAIFVAEACC